MKTKQLFQFVALPLLAFIIYRLITGPTQFSFLCNIFGVACPVVKLNENFVAPGFEPVREQFLQLLQTQDMGSCVVAFQRGQLIVNLCGGVTDGKDVIQSLLQNNKPYTHRNIQIIYSVTKAISALVVAMLVDRGHLDYHQKVSYYWKEFGTKGKENVTVSELLQHRGGVWVIDTPLTKELLHDLDKLDVILAEQPHFFNGTNTMAAYHALSYGFYLNALVRRVDPQKRTIGQFVRDEVNRKLGVEVIIGVQPNEEKEIQHRLSPFYAYERIYYLLRALPKLVLPEFILEQFFKVKKLHESVRCILKEFLFVKDSPLRKSYEIVKDYQLGYDFEAYRSESPGANGLSNAASLAAIASALSQGGTHKQVSLLSTTTLQDAMKLEGPVFDRGLCREFNRTKGGWAEFNLNGAIGYGWPGLGGAHILWNEEEQLGFGYVPNTGEEQTGVRGLTLYKTVFDTIQKFKK